MSVLSDRCVCVVVVVILILLILGCICMNTKTDPTPPPPKPSKTYYDCTKLGSGTCEQVSYPTQWQDKKACEGFRCAAGLRYGDVVYLTYTGKCPDIIICNGYGVFHDKLDHNNLQLSNQRTPLTLRSTLDQDTSSDPQLGNLIIPDEDVYLYDAHLQAWVVNTKGCKKLSFAEVNVPTQHPIFSFQHTDTTSPDKAIQNGEKIYWMSSRQNNCHKPVVGVRKGPGKNIATMCSLSPTTQKQYATWKLIKA